MFRRPVLAATLITLMLSACGPKPAAAGPSPDAPPVAEAPTVPPPPPADPLAVGSQDAKDDLYCSGLILAANPTPDSALSPSEQAEIIRIQNSGIDLGDAGMNKLINQKVAHATHAGFISQAYIDKADSDLTAKTVRIPMENCLARAAALPPPPQ